jgi:hypothetical protein
MDKILARFFKGELNMVDIMDKLQGVTEIGKSTREKQATINVSEVFYIWDIQVMKFDMLETMHIIENFINDYDLKYIFNKIVDALKSGINEMEQLIKDYGIPFPVRPPIFSKTSTMWEHFTDRFIYEEIFGSIQSFFPILASAFMNATSPRVRKAFKNHLLLSVELQELIIEYGKLKGFLIETPIYRA